MLSVAVECYLYHESEVTPTLRIWGYPNVANLRLPQRCKSEVTPTLIYVKKDHDIWREIYTRGLCVVCCGGHLCDVFEVTPTSTSMYVKRDLIIRKETYTGVLCVVSCSRTTCVSRIWGLHSGQKRPRNAKRDLHKSQETFINLKRPKLETCKRAVCVVGLFCGL